MKKNRKTVVVSKQKRTNGSNGVQPKAGNEAVSTATIKKDYNDCHQESSEGVFYVTFTLSMAIYLRTVAPTVVGGDTGELLAEGCSLGIAHPPGYPLYTMLVYAVTQLLPNFMNTREASPALLMNLTSSLFGALASGLISVTVQMYAGAFSGNNLRLQQVVAIAIGLLHTCSPLVWQYSVTAEVFALHNFFVALILYTSICFARHQKGMMYVGAFICGLAMTNQHTSVLLEIPIILWVIYEAKLLEKQWELAKVALCYIIGLLPYAYLPLAAIYAPKRGSWGDVTTFQGFWNHFTRKDYGSFKLYSGGGAEEDDLMDRVVVWATDFWQNQAGNVIVALFFVYGCMVVVANKIRGGSNSRVANVGLVWLLSLVFYVTVFFSLSNLPLGQPLFLGVFKRFWMQPNILCFVLAGIGMTDIVSRLSDTTVWRALVLVFLMTSMVHSYWTNVAMSDQSDNTYFLHYGKSILESLPTNSLLLLTGDPDWNTVRYLQDCENVRPDVTSLSLNDMRRSGWKMQKTMVENVKFPGDVIVSDTSALRQDGRGGFTFSELLDANYDNFDGKVFLSLWVGYHDGRYIDNWEEVPHGFLHHLVRKENVDKDPERFRIQTLETWQPIASRMAFDLPDPIKYNDETWEYWVRGQFFKMMRFRASYLLNLANRKDHGTEIPVIHALVESVAWLEMAHVYADEEEQAVIRKNIAIGTLGIRRNKEEAYQEAPPELYNVFTNENNTEWMDAIQHVWFTNNSWTDWVQRRWHDAFREFLQTPGADEMGEYAAMKSFYESSIKQK